MRKLIVAFTLLVILLSLVASLAGVIHMDTTPTAHSPQHEAR